LGVLDGVRFGIAVGNADDKAITADSSAAKFEAAEGRCFAPERLPKMRKRRRAVNRKSKRSIALGISRESTQKISVCIKQPECHFCAGRKSAECSGFFKKPIQVTWADFTHLKACNWVGCAESSQSACGAAYGFNPIHPSLSLVLVVGLRLFAGLDRDG